EQSAADDCPHHETHRRFPRKDHTLETGERGHTRACAAAVSKGSLPSQNRGGPCQMCGSLATWAHRHNNFGPWTAGNGLESGLLPSRTPLHCAMPDLLTLAVVAL